MTIDVKLMSVYWCAFSWSKPKFFGLKQHEIWFKCLCQQGRSQDLKEVPQNFTEFFNIAAVTGNDVRKSNQNRKENRKKFELPYKLPY